jgi:biopolymer transport protein ExbD
MIVCGLVVIALGAGSRAQPPFDQAASKSIEFKSVKDKVPLGLRDTAAFVSSLEQAREMRPNDHSQDGRSEFVLQEIPEHSDRYRGVPLVVRGIARRLYSSQSPLAAGNRLFEVWITTPGKRANPIACIIEELPRSFPDRPVISEPVVVRGFFLKLMAYKVGDRDFVAPLLIGRLEHIARQDLNVIEPPPDEVFVRLPEGAEPRSVGPAAEEKFSLELDRNGRLTIDGEAIARKALSKKIERLAESIRFNVRAGGVLLPADRELPAALTFRAPAATPCTTIYKLMLDCQACGFLKFALELASDDPATAEPRKPAAPPPARKENNLPDEQRTIEIRLRADQKGQIGRLQLGNHTLQGFDALKRELTEILNDPHAPFDRANIQLDPRLRYSEMVRVAKLLANQLMSAIHFTLAEAPGRR